MSNGEDPATKEVRTNVTDTMAAADKTLPTYAAAINSPNTDALPSYDQVFQQLRKAKENSKSPVDYTVKALGIICGSLIVTILFAISAAIPIAMLVIGSIYKDQCPINRQIPIWLIVGGVVGLLSAVLRSISNCHNMFTKRRLDQEPEQNISNKSALLSILELFLFIWLIIGSVWVYSAKYAVTSDSTDYDNYCHPTCYYFAFWVITVSYIVMATMCCCLCCIVMCVGFGLSLSSLSKDVNNQSQIP